MQSVKIYKGNLLLKGLTVTGWKIFNDSKSWNRLSWNRLTEIRDLDTNACFFVKESSMKVLGEVDKELLIILKDYNANS